MQSERLPSVVELEGLAPPQPRPAVLEFTPPSPPPTASLVAQEVVEAVRRSGPQDAPRLQAGTVLRPITVAHARTNAYRTCGSVYEWIERMNSGALRPDRDILGSPNIPTLVTQVCWLNHTIRTWSDPRVLSEAAGDESVVAVDVPRALTLDTLQTGPIVGATSFRESTGFKGEGIIVAVIDSEVARDHPAFGNRVVHRRNYTPENWGRPKGHGTAVAGIVAAEDAQFPGIAPGATIYNYKVVPTDPVGVSTDFDGALALQQALEDGAHVANCSWGTGLASDGKSREALAVNEAWALGLVIVKSAGNRGPEAGSLTSPADADGVIVVGATDGSGTQLESYSSRGPTPNGLARPHVVAPGGTRTNSLYSCLLGGGMGPIADAGTSYAAPHISGLAALLLDRSPDLTPDQVREQLIASARRLDSVDAAAQGAGLVSIG